MATASRVLVIGLDCAAPQLVLERWRDELPTLAGLAARGSSGVLESCRPCITVPAWSVMTSSRSPGSLGVYGFRNRRDHSYDGMTMADSRAIRVPRLWDLLSAAGRDVVALGVPGTYPVTPVRGVMVSCFLTPDVERHQYTHPHDLRHEIRDLVGRYMVDVDDFRTEDKTRLLADIEEMTARRFTVAEHLMRTRPWDLFFMVEMGTDRIHHGFWRYMDPEHRLYEAGHPLEGAMLDYYRRLDGRIARLLELVDEETAVLVVSDHGAKRMDGGICINEWLRREGLLVLREDPPAPAPLRPQMVDWERTTAWGEGGYYARLWLNVRGREPQGIVGAEDFLAVRERIRRALERLGDDRGAPIGTVAYAPEELYPDVRGVPPDLLVYFGGLHWRSIGQVGGGAVHVFENDTGPDDANHAEEGMYVLAAPGVAPDAGVRHGILDVAPTVLELLGEPVPGDMEGRSMVRKPAVSRPAAAAPAAR